MRKSPNWAGTGSTALRLQSDNPTAANENGPEAGGVSVARASVIRGARSEPNHGFARPPLTGLRVVATRTVALTASAEASRRVLRHAGAAAKGATKRERASRGHEPAQEDATRRNGFLLQRMPDSHRDLRGTPGA